MRLNGAVLCDAASVREGLLHVLGGGVTLLTRDAFPSRMGVTLAILVDMEVADDAAHTLTVKIRPQGDQQTIAEVRGEFGVGPDSGAEALDDPLSPMIPLVVPLVDLPLPKPGRYELGVSLDDAPEYILRFDAVAPPDN